MISIQQAAAAAPAGSISISVFTSTPTSNAPKCSRQERSGTLCRGQAFDYHSFALTNNSANIRRLEKRLAILQKAQSNETTEEKFPGGIRLIDNVEDNPLQIFFAEIPSEATRRELKSNGFRWSPSV